MNNIPTYITPAGAVVSQFEDLFRLHHRKCLAFARRISGNREEAEDLAQDAFYRAYRAFDKFDKERSFESWVYRIITNLFIDRQRARRRAPIYSLDAPLPGGDRNLLTKELTDSRSDPSQSVLDEVMDERLAEALAKLPETLRSTMILVDVHELSYEAAAQRLNCAVGTIRSRLHRARKQMRGMLTA